MAKKQARARSVAPKETAPARPPAPLSIPAEAALSFLKDTKGAVTWTVLELANTLKINRADAERVISLLQAQGYVQRAHANGGWITTPSGETVSGAKAPRFDRESVERALGSLQERIKEANRDAKSPFEITGAVAFGDFLVKERARVQAADVGVQLARRGDGGSDLHSAWGAREERAFLRQLRGRGALLVLRPYAEWMKNRSNLNLL
jgi:DNA-binding transcriptional regulator YhcF (GntR family)